MKTRTGVNGFDRIGRDYLRFVLASDDPLHHDVEDAIVSTDVIGDPASCVSDSSLTQASGRLVKVFGSYDNEWGYTARQIDLTRLVAASG